MQVVWSSAEDPAPVFVQSFQLGERGTAWVFGERYEIAGALFDSDSLGDSHVVEYFVVTGGPAATWRCTRLMQHEDVVYSAPLEPVGHVPAVQVDAADRSIGEPPRWDSRTAAISTYSGDPMQFVGQVAPPANHATATPLTGVTLYLFRSHDGEDYFALVIQDTSEQSAAEHYALEEEFN